MSALSTKLVVVTFTSLGIASQACTLASPTEVQMVPAKQESGATEADHKDAGSSGKDDGPTCSAKFAKPDLASLKACGNGKGHCSPKEKMTTPMQKFFAADTCAGGDVCVDDEFIKAGGEELKTCTGIGGVGRCVVFELNAPMVADERSVALKNAKSNCPDGLVCIPCTDPSNNNADTGVCHKQGLTAGACSGGPATETAKAPAPPAQTCCGGKGTCIDGAGIGDSMEKDSCTGDNMVCAPQSLVTSKARTCKAGLILGKGICMDGCFNDLLKNLGGIILDKETCDENELCLPCLFAAKMAPDGVKVPGCE